MYYTRILLSLACCLAMKMTYAQPGAVSATRAQATSTSATDSVRAAVNALFVAMKNSDSVALTDAFDDSAVLQTLETDSSGATVARTYGVVQFAAAIGRLPKGVAEEQIRIDALKIDGPLAIVWASYHFYYNGVFIHCGIDSFQLIKGRKGWKILYIVDTMKKGAACD